MSIRIMGRALRRQISRCNFGARSAVAGAVVLAVVVTAVPVLAETLPSVEVDLSALDQLGPARPVRAKDRITLRRPKSTPVTVAKKPAAKQPAAAAKPAPPAAKKPETAKKPEPAPEVVKEPEPAPEVAKEPEPAPEVVKEPEPAPEVAKEPEPETVKEPERAKEPEKEPEAAPKPTETAAVPPAASPVASPTGMIRLAFASGSAELPDGAAVKLAALATQMKNDETMRVQLRGFASGDGSVGRQARRLALSRALAVRLYLTQNGVGGTRALVRALGSETEERPMDRVDVVVIE